MSQILAAARAYSLNAAKIVVASLSIATSGCLSIGGKTEVVASPETDMRMSSLESRVATLERTLGVSSVPPTLSSSATTSGRRAATAAAEVEESDPLRGNFSNKPLGL